MATICMAECNACNFELIATHDNHLMHTGECERKQILRENEDSLRL